MTAIAIPSPALVQAILFLIAARPANGNGADRGRRHHSLAHTVKR